MKQKKTKLTVKKETISNLDVREMENVKGGAPASQTICDPVCPSSVNTKW